jgi:zinc transport system substrate-binding protein
MIVMSLRRRPVSPAAAPAILAALTGLALLASGCGSGSSAADGAGSGSKPQVIASFYPLEYVARQVGGSDVAVQNLTKPGVEPHDMELNPRQVATISEAGLVVYLKGFQPAVDEAVDQNKPKASLDAATIVPLVEREGVEDEHAEEEGHDKEASPGTEESHAEEEEHAKDPHIWLDPTKFAAVVTAIGDKLAGIDPGHAEGYRSRAADLVKRLETLDTEFKTGLATCKRKDLVTSHTAFGYLADRYGLTQVGITGVSPDAEPSLTRLGELQRLVAAKGVTTVFFETLVSPKAAQTLARDAKIEAAVLDPVEGIADPAKEDYFSVMRANLTALRKALACT